MEDLHLHDVLAPTPVYNDNCGCIDWAATFSTKSLCHFNIRENAVRDAIQYREITLAHVAGVTNPVNLFTKEHKDQVHFLALTNSVLSPPPGSMGVLAV
jgi:hypothetical protein